MCKITLTYVCTHMLLYIPYNTTYILTSYYYYISPSIQSATSWSGGFDTWPLLVIVVPGIDGLAITSGDWSGGTSASKSSGEFAIGPSLLNTFDSFKLFL